MRGVIRDINVRHDRSGEYPHSEVECSGERWIVNLARAPHDDKYHCVDVLCSDPPDAAPGPPDDAMDIC
jgi:hypothetical protein